MNNSNNIIHDEVLQLCYKLYKLENNENIILYSYTGFIKDEEYKKYYNSVLKKLRIDKLNKICSNQVIK